MIFNHTPWNWHTRYCRTGIPSAVSRVDNVQSCQDISHHGTLKNGPKHDGITILKNQDVRVIHVEIQMLPHVDYSPCICIYIIIILSHNLFPTVFRNDLFPMIMIIQYYPIIFPIYISHNICISLWLSNEYPRKLGTWWVWCDFAPKPGSTGEALGMTTRQSGDS